MDRRIMKFVSPPIVGALGSARSGDDLDRLLRAFFQAEMPHPWPELEPTASATVPSTRLAIWRQIKRSHLALAASVALLIAGSLLFSGKLPLSASHLLPPPNVDPISSRPTDFAPQKVKESIDVTPDGAAIRLDYVGEDRY
jgi:hypothetical protein